MNLTEALNWRYACKKFDATKKISQDQIDQLIESLRLAPSSYGLQPWVFIHLKDNDLREKMVEVSYNQRQVEEASELFILCAKSDINESHIDSYLNDISQKRKVSLESLSGFKKMLMNIPSWDESRKNTWADKQLYIALGSLLTACAILNIDACPMEGFKPKEVDKILGLGDLGLRSVLLCPVGYRSQEDDYALKEKVRFDKDIVIKSI